VHAVKPGLKPENIDDTKIKIIQQKQNSPGLKKNQYGAAEDYGALKKIYQQRKTRKNFL